MKSHVSDIAFTPAVKTVQTQKGSRRGYQRMAEKGGWSDKVDSYLAGFIAQRDSFYIGTASADGRPYIQHRGGPKGFLKVVDESTLAFADFAGNRQYISMGNLGDNDQAYLFLMDYPNQARVKIWGRAEIVEDQPELLESLLEPGYKARPERVFLFHIEAWDTNCPQHITPRFTAEDIAPALDALKARIAELEDQLAAYTPDTPPTH
jgi:predicted pyridoxine 5'-phosphate oxidase superfamily flavin-nucleotide-binding protein